jgi:hypothetical protein
MLFDCAAVFFDGDVFVSACGRFFSHTTSLIVTKL